MTNIITKASTNRKLYVFLFCLLLATFFWLLNSLGNQFTTEIEVKAVYVNAPANKIIINKQPQSFRLKVKGYGFDLLAYKLKPTHPVVTLDLSQLDRIRYQNNIMTYSIATNSYNDFIANQLGDEIEIKTIYPDSIRFVMDKAIQKQVKIVPLANLEYKKQFQLFGKILAKPAITTIVGPKSIVDTLEAVYTQEMVYYDLDETKTETIGFDASYAHSKISFSPNKVLVHVPVEKFTESSRLVPITTLNVPDSILLKTIPQETRVTFMLPLSKMPNLASAEFEAVVDFQQIKNSYNHKLKVELIKQPDYIKLKRVNPSKVEYILKRK